MQRLQADSLAHNQSNKAGAAATAAAKLWQHLTLTTV
jgi:hypothetical protein